MPLVKLEDFDQTTAKVLMATSREWGSIQTQMRRLAQSTMLVDEEGHFRYFIVDLGFWIFGKSFAPSWTFPVDYNSDRVYAVGMTRDQATIYLSSARI